MAIGISALQMASLTREDLLAFLGTRQPEVSGYVDYKRTVSSPVPTHDPTGKATPSDVLRAPLYREFLKDVSAFANASGGLLVIGASEPSEEATPGEQLVGCDQTIWKSLRFESDAALIKALQDVCASSLDPRIPDLRFSPVPVSSDRFALVVRVSASPMKPHMVNHGGVASFYVRHQGSVRAMTSEEIRSSVLDSATAEGQARTYCLVQQQRVLELHDGSSPLLLMQAVPLARISKRWDLQTPEFAESVRGSKRSQAQSRGYWDTWSSRERPTPILEGLLGRDSGDSPRWESEIHKVGYVHVWNSKYRFASRVDPPRIGMLADGHAVHLKSFASLVEECWEAAKEDPPCLLRCTMFGTGGSLLYLGPNRFEPWSDPCKRRDLPFDEIVRQPGESPAALVKAWIDQLYHGFELNPPETE